MSEMHVPGLIRPYDNNKSYVSANFKTITMNGKTSRIDPSSDPYSRYDDDSDQDINFLVPGAKLDLKRFTKAFSELNSSENKQTCKMQPCSKRKPPKPPGEAFIAGSGDYCHLNPDAKTSGTSNTYNTNHNKHIKKENLEKYAKKLVTSDITNVNQHTVHSFDGRNSKKASYVDIDLNSGKHSAKLKKNDKIDHIIEWCTCMKCIRGVSYHSTSDDVGDKFVEPCSCIGPRKKVISRWLCMGVLAIFLPCLCCYLPARLCQDACSECSSRTKLKENPNRVLYIKDSNENNSLL